MSCGKLMLIGGFLFGNPVGRYWGKAPIGRRWGVVKPSTRALFAIFKRHPRAGIGIVLGPASGVVDLEVDDLEAARPLLEELFPRGLPPTMGWMSSRGEHRLFRWDDRLGPSHSAVVHLAGGALELRLGSGGRQVAAVCPPSPTSDGSPRRWNGVWEIAPCPPALIEVVERRIDAPHTRVARPTPTRRRDRDTLARYGLAALGRELALVRSAGPGTRNEALIRSAFRLGQLVGAGLIERGVVEAELAGAASDAGLGAREAAATIRRGIDAGSQHPRGPGARG
jgi:putative DNA primase/helicase